MKMNVFIAITIVCAYFYVSADVDQSSGSMVFNQDLVAVQSGTITLPLSLSYRSGIQITDRASWVGLGFNLNLPYIERFPNGSVDEKPGIFKCPNLFGYYSQKNYNELLKDEGNGYVMPEQGNYTDEQDIYVAHGMFNDRIIFDHAFIDRKLRAYFVNSLPYKINYRINEYKDIYKWEIVDDNGIKYTFGSDNYQEGIVKAMPIMGGEERITGFSQDDFYSKKYYPSYYVNSSFNMRWYLTKIEAPNGDIINITYTPQNQYPSVAIKDLFYYLWLSTGKDFLNDDLPVTSIFRTSDNKVTFTRDFDCYSILPIYPIAIEGSQGKVTFSFIQSPSKDVLYQGTNCLDKILFIPEIQMNMC